MIWKKQKQIDPKQTEIEKNITYINTQIIQLEQMIWTLNQQKISFMENKQRMEKELNDILSEQRKQITG